MKENRDLNSKIKFPKTAIQETGISPGTNSPKFKKISIQLGVGTLVNLDEKIPKKKSMEVNSIDS